MRIGIDGCCWSNQRGFGRYTRELIRALAGICSESDFHEICVVVDQQTAAGHEFPAGIELAVAKTRRQPTLAAAAQSRRTLADMWRLHRVAAGRKLDVLLYPAVYTYFPPPRGLPTVVTFHDAIAEEYPDLIFPRLSSRWAWELKLRVAIRRADRILTVSEAARHQLEAAFKIESHRMAVTSEGVAPEFRPIDDSAELERIRRTYDLPAATPIILYVGGLSPHKNLDVLLRACADMDQAHRGDWACVLVGETDHESFHTCYRELVEMTRSLGIEKRVFFSGFVPDADLVALYNLATLLVMPSFSEGFGLPVAEAMACGLPVVVSDREALRETTGDAGILFDPENHGHLVAALSRVLGDPELRSRHRELGFRVAEGFSWRAAGERALRVLEDVAGKTAPSRDLG